VTTRRSTTQFFLAALRLCQAIMREQVAILSIFAHLVVRALSLGYAWIILRAGGL